MIRGFKDKRARALFAGRIPKQFQAFARQAQRRLQILDAAESLEDLRGLPSNRLEALRGDRKGQYSIRINAQWRLCFRWHDSGEATEVEIVDYHR